MARRKNVKRIDPRYFLHETVNRNDDGSRMEESNQCVSRLCEAGRCTCDHTGCHSNPKGRQDCDTGLRIRGLEEAEFQDTGFGEEDIEVNRAAASSGFEEMQAQIQMRNKVIEAAVEAVGDWIEDEDDNDWPEAGVDDRKTFLQKLHQYADTYAGVSVADVLGIKLG